ncbi:butyrate kinase [Anaerosalibacter massiliensis]|uniref:Probable butyrate kinase n=1 Tax=Anaerosalibacter massiliensis TaxID=1347392 RepID=A0A9X2MFZ4_9FIRM|nr:butyrate kinase [Anaerosalibacter massiliensis]MCR2044332.1 butyrate kinase [Anaerosalibacter massiliensis]
MGYKILAINPGSTSTKIALYDNENEVFTETLEHPIDKIEKYDKTIDQFEMRKDLVISFLKENRYNIGNLSAVVGRGGMLPTVKSGAYIVNETMLDVLSNRPVMEHASNLGAPIAYEIAKIAGVKAYIYDSVRTDELKDIARISGMPDIPRTSTCHVLNTRATAIKVAKKYGKKYQDMNFVIAHLGGGISLNVHEKGRIVDIISDDEGPFSPERAGRVPCRELIDLCFSGKYDKKTMQRKLRGNGGLKAYLNTVDAREVEKMIKNGDEKAKIIYESMAYQVAKGIGELATVIDGKVDVIILTGGIAYSDMMVSWIKKRVEFIAPVEIVPGENEMESLAYGTLRVLKGEEAAREYEI